MLEAVFQIIETVSELFHLMTMATFMRLASPTRKNTKHMDKNFHRCVTPKSNTARCRIPDPPTADDKDRQSRTLRRAERENGGKDQSTLATIPTTRPRTPDPSGVRAEERDADDRQRRRGRKPGNRDPAPSDVQDSSGVECNIQTQSKTASERVSRSRSRTPTGFRFRGRSLNKRGRDRKRSTSRKSTPKGGLDNGRKQRSRSRLRGRFLSKPRKKKSNSDHVRSTSPGQRPNSRTKERLVKHFKEKILHMGKVTADAGDREISRNRCYSDPNDVHIKDTPEGYAIGEIRKKVTYVIEDKYQPRLDYSIDDSNSLIVGLPLGDDPFADFFHKKDQSVSVDSTFFERNSFDDSVLYANLDGWLANYDVCLGALCDFDVEAPLPRQKTIQHQGDCTRFGEPSCSLNDSSCDFIELKDEVVMDILERTREVREAIARECEQRDAEPAASEWCAVNHVENEPTKRVDRS